jgi:hypothetical protein
MGADVNTSLTVLFRATVVPYSSGVQQPMRATTALGRAWPHWEISTATGRAMVLHEAGLA